MHYLALFLALAAPTDLARLPGVQVVVDSRHRDRWGLDVCRPEAVLDGRAADAYRDAWASDNWEVTHTLALVFPRAVSVTSVGLQWPMVNGAPATPRACRVEGLVAGGWRELAALSGRAAEAQTTLPVTGDRVQGIRLVQPPDGAAANADRRLWVAEVSVTGTPVEPVEVVAAPALAQRLRTELAAQRRREDDARTAPIVARAMAPRKTKGLLGPIRAADVVRARRLVATKPWATAAAESYQRSAAWWLEQSDEAIYQLIPVGNPRALCPSFEKGCPLHGGARGTFTASLEKPYRWRCAKGGEEWYDGAVVRHPQTGQGVVVHDDGAGFLAPAGFAEAGRRFYFVAAWRYFALGKLFGTPYEGDQGSQWPGTTAVKHLAIAYALTGDARYAHKAAVMLNRLAEVYRFYDGCVEGPSQRQDGYIGQGFEKFWSQEILLSCDLIWDALAGDEALRRFFAAHGQADYDGDGAVTADDVPFNLQRHLIGYTYEYLHRLMPYFDGDFLMYEMTALAACASVLGNADLAEEALESDVGLRVMLQNSWFRDGKFIYDSAGYNLGNASTPLLIAEWLHGFTAPPRYRQPLDLFHERDFRIARLFDFIRELDCDGRVPQIGDVGGARALVLRTEPLYDQRVEQAYLRLPEQREQYRRTLLAAAAGDVDRRRNGHHEWWLLFKAADAPAPTGQVAPLEPPRSHLFEDGGFAILRAGADAATRVHVPLTFTKGQYAHGHLDKLAINLFRHGFDFSADLGYPTTWTDLKTGGWTSHTASHCTVMLDAAPQRGNVVGRLHFYATQPLVDVVEAAAPAYAQAKIYQRTVALVRDEAGEPLYCADVFRTDGGRVRDWLWHSLGQPEDLTITGADGPLAFSAPAAGSLLGADVAPMTKAGYGFLFGVQRARSDGGIVAAWRNRGATSQPDRYLLTRRTFGQATIEFTLCRTGRASGREERLVFVFGVPEGNPANRRHVQMPVERFPVGRPLPVRIELDGAHVRVLVEGQPAGTTTPVGSPADVGAFGLLHYYHYGWEFRDLVFRPAGEAPLRVDLTRPLDPAFWARIDPTYRVAGGALVVADAEQTLFHLHAAGAPGREVLRAKAEGYGLRGSSPLEGHLILRDQPTDAGALSTWAAAMEATNREPRLQRVAALALTPVDPRVTALRIVAADRVDYLFSAVSPTSVAEVTADGHRLSFRGRFGLVATRGDRVIGQTLVGPGELRCDDAVLRVPEAAPGRIDSVRVADDSVVVADGAPLSAGDLVLIDGAGYACPAVYKVVRVAPEAGAQRVYLNQPLVIARGVVGARSESSLASRTPVMKLQVNPGLFNGKPLLPWPDGELVRMRTATPAAFTPAAGSSLRQFRTDGEYAVLDVGPGDTVTTVPTGSR